MSGVGGLLELYWNFIGVDRNFIGTVSLRYCYVIATLLLRYRYVIGGRSGLDRGCPIYGASPSARGARGFTTHDPWHVHISTKHVHMHVHGAVLIRAKTKAYRPG